MGNSKAIALALFAALAFSSASNTGHYDWRSKLREIEGYGNSNGSSHGNGVGNNGHSNGEYNNGSNNGNYNTGSNNGNNNRGSNNGNNNGGSNNGNNNGGHNNGNNNGVGNSRYVSGPTTRPYSAQYMKPTTRWASRRTPSPATPSRRYSPYRRTTFKPTVREYSTTPTYGNVARDTSATTTSVYRPRPYSNWRDYADGQYWTNYYRPGRPYQYTGPSYDYSYKPRHWSSYTPGYGVHY